MTDNPYAAPSTPLNPPSPQAPQTTPTSPPKTSAMAVTAFVLSLIFFVPFIPLIGAILGIVATVRISKRRHQLGGFGLAVAAIPTGFVLFFFVTGIWAAIAIPAFIKYVRKAKTVEATDSLDKIGMGARAYYLSDRYGDDGSLLARQFPRGNTNWVPAKPCCGSTPKCPPRPTQWKAEPWRALSFSLDHGHYFQYRYRSSGSGAEATFVAEARGDLDCDGVFSSYKVFGKVDPQGDPVLQGPVISNEIE